MIKVRNMEIHKDKCEVRLKKDYITDINRIKI